MFGRKGQGHECAPALSLEEYFSTGPERERPIFEAVAAHLQGLGPVHIEPVSVGIFFKRARTFVELRPMRSWVAVSFMLPRKVVDGRLARKVLGDGRRYYHVVNVRGPEEVDEQLKGWLTESFLSVPE
jgi:hypothetical protein